MAFAYSYFFIAAIDEIDTTSLCRILTDYLIGVRSFARRDNLNAGARKKIHQNKSDRRPLTSKTRQLLRYFPRPGALRGRWFGRGVPWYGWRG
jgi:hypothetical protein